jgi:hypothetical protein
MQLYASVLRGKNEKETTQIVNHCFIAVFMANDFNALELTGGVNQHLAFHQQKVLE